MKLSARLRSGGLPRQIATLVSGTALAQVILLLCTPLLTRLYGPAAFGVLGTFLAVADTLKPVSALSLPGAIVIARDEHSARQVARASYAVGIAMCVLMAGLLLALIRPAAAWLGIGDHAALLWCLPLVMLASTAIQVSQQWLLRHGRAAPIAAASALHSGISGSSQIVAGFLAPGAALLVVTSSIAYAAHGVILARFAKGQRLDSQFRASGPGTLGILKLHRDFPLFRAPQQLINSFAQSAPVLLLAVVAGPVPAGLFTVAKRVLSAPVALVGKAVSDTFYPSIARRARANAPLGGPTRKLTLALAGLGIGPFALVIAFAPGLFGLLFGADWVQAGEYARWIALWSFTTLLSRPAVATIPVLRRQGAFLTFEVATVVLRIATLVVAYAVTRDDVYTVAAFSIICATTNITLILITRHWIHRLVRTQQSDSDRP